MTSPGDSLEPNTVLDLFRSELNASLSLLHPWKIQSSIDTLRNEVHKIKGGAKIAQAMQIAEFAGVFEEFLKTQIAIDNENLPLIDEMLKVFKKFGEAEISEWKKLIADTRQQMQTLTHRLKSPAPVQPQVQPISTIQPESQLEIDTTMLELFRSEVEVQTKVLNQGLVDFEQMEQNGEMLQALMRAAHSIKGAARVLGLSHIVSLSHAIEDCFVAAQKGNIIIKPDHVDILLQGVDLLSKITEIPQNSIKPWAEEQQPEITKIISAINSRILQHNTEKHSEPAPPKKAEIPHILKKDSPQDRVLRVTAQNLNRLMGFAGESLVESRWLQPFSNSLLSIKKAINDLSILEDKLRETLEQKGSDESLENHLVTLQHKVSQCGQGLSDRLSELDMFILRHSSLSDRLYREVVDIRMRPFSDGVEAFPRMVRDLARTLDKKVRLEIVGKSTPVDRDILDKLEAPLNHLIRNAIDHGIEPPDVRVKLGKPPEGVIKVEAIHRAGMLAITVSDDGRGVDISNLRAKIAERNLIKSNILEAMNETELLDFLFLPGFSTSENVNEISGRGVGLNVVLNMVQEVSGTVRAYANPGKGMVFQLLLPLTLSVIRALIVNISGEPYAFPLPRIDRALNIPQNQIEIIENRQYIKFEGQNIGLVPAAQVLGLAENKIASEELSIIIISDQMNSYGIVVEGFLGERELVVLELDSILGKTADISSGALMEDGTPVLIVDIEDLVRSIDNILNAGRLHKLGYTKDVAGEKHRKRVLVIDDSITVREVECRLLQNKGYDVLSAVNGIDGLNALRMGKFDLVITDVDMPRMNGIELVRLIRNDPKLTKLPVMIVSYKERAEDRLLGLEAGANFYLTKGSFHDETLINAVIELIGVP